MQTTSWQVITGAPCSGKTSVIQALEEAGYSVVHEAARAYIDSELKQGRQIEEIKANEQVFEDHILKQKIQKEISLDPADIVFLDRAIPDSIAYYRFAGLDTVRPIQESLRFRYQNVFLFKRLTLVDDPVRSEDDSIARQLEKLLADSYRELSYQVRWVPLLPVKKRVEYILQYLE